MPDLTPAIEEAMTEWRNNGHSGDTKIDVHRALAQLPAPNRRLVVLRVFEGHTWKECAEEMSKGRAHTMTAEAARSMFRTSAVTLKKILSGQAKATPLVKSRRS